MRLVTSLVDENCIPVLVVKFIIVILIFVFNLRGLKLLTLLIYLKVSYSTHLTIPGISTFVKIFKVHFYSGSIK